MLRADPKLRCTNTTDCLNKVKSGSHVYIQVIYNSLKSKHYNGTIGNKIIITLKVASNLHEIVDADYRSTGECHFGIAKDTFWPLTTFMALAKGSPNTESFSRGYSCIE